MLTSGDVVGLDLGTPQGPEAGFSRPAVVATAQTILDGSPTIVHVVPLTSVVRRFKTEIIVAANAGSGLDAPSAVQCQHIRSVSADRIDRVRGNVGPVVLGQIREIIGQILDLVS